MKDFVLDSIPPSLTYCHDNGGNIIPEISAEGKVNCVFPNGKTCDAGDYYNQLCDYKFNPKVVFNKLVKCGETGLYNIANNYNSSLLTFLIIGISCLVAVIILKLKK
jgi:Domain of unknown function (DUF333)